MVIVLPDADFSANSIGKIVIDRDLSTDAISLLSHYTKLLTKSAQLAVDEFISDCKDAGLWDKIKLMMFPILAGTLNECFYDFKSNSVAAPSALTLYSRNNLGLYINAAGNPSRVVKGMSGVTNSNFHACCYISANSGSNPYLMSSGPVTPAWWLSQYGLQIGTNTDNIKATCDVNSVNIKGAKIATARGVTANDVDLLYSGIPTTGRSLAGAGIGVGGLEVGSFQPNGYETYTGLNIPYAYYSLGTSMTLTEMQTYSVLLENMMGVLLSE